MKKAVITVTLCALLFLLGSWVEAQQQKIYKIGRLSAGAPTDPLNKAAYEAFQKGLRDLGWIEKENIALESRWVKDEEANQAAAELVRLNVDVIVAVGSPMTQVAKQATSTIPIVMSGTGADPVTAGFVASLRRPGGNITGLSMLSTELSGKRLELLREMTAKLRRVAVLRNPRFPAVAVQSKETEMAAKSLRLQLQAWEVNTPGEIETAFSAMNKTGVGGLIVFSDPIILERNRRSIIAFALKYRLPTVNARSP